MKVKICGITRLEDAQHAAALGADFLGFIFVKESPRYRDAEHAAQIAGVSLRSRLPSKPVSGCSPGQAAGLAAGSPS